MDASFGPNVSAVSSAPIGISRCMSMSPVSSPASMRMVVTPVTDSPLAIAHWIGAAPRYLGSSEACRFKFPNRGSSIIHCGMMRPYPTTIIASGTMAANWSRNTALFLMVAGCTTAIRRRIAASFTGEAATSMPRPRGRSGCVTTSGRECPASTSFSRVGTAKRGVPQKTKRIDIYIDNRQSMKDIESQPLAHNVNHDRRYPALPKVGGYSACRQLQFHTQRSSRIFSRPHVKQSRLHSPAFGLRAPKTKLIGTEREGQRLRRTGGERDAPESLQLPHGTRGRSCALMNVNLRDRVACGLAAVGHIDGNFGSFSRRQAGLIQPQIAELEAGVTQPKPEREKRFGRKVPVARLEIGFVLGLLRKVVVVVERFLASDARPRDRQLAARVHIAKEHV